MFSSGVGTMIFVWLRSTIICVSELMLNGFAVSNIRYTRSREEDSSSVFTKCVLPFAQNVFCREEDSSSV